MGTRWQIASLYSLFKETARYEFPCHGDKCKNPNESCAKASCDVELLKKKKDCCKEFGRVTRGQYTAL